MSDLPPFWRSPLFRREQVDELGGEGRRLWVRLDDALGASLGSSREHCIFRSPFSAAAIGWSARRNPLSKALALVAVEEDVHSKKSPAMRSGAPKPPNTLF
jgi:hypothetical protein